MRKSAHNLLAAVASLLWLWALSTPSSAQTVTFDVYPASAQVYREGANSQGLVPLGPAGEPLSLNEEFDNLNLLKLVIQDEGRQPWRRTVSGGEFKDGEVVAVYLSPTNPLAYLTDFPRYRRKAFALTSLVMLAALGVAGSLIRQRLLKREAERAIQRRKDVLESVGYEYERPFGKWLIIGKLGSGGMGEVLRAFPQDDIRRESMVALKMRTGIDTSGATQELLEHDAQDRARFQIETKVLCGLDHPGIVKIHDWGELDNKDYFVMDLVRGENLETYLKRTPRPPYREVFDMFGQLLDVMIFAHQKRVLHRDLKPLNILRRSDGRMVVIDFGLARDQSRTVALTQMGMPLAGTFEYMDPRACLQAMAQLEPTPSDEATDQFSLGAILFLMLTGKPSLELAPDADLLTILTKVSEPRPSPLLYRDDLPEAVVAVVNTMLAVEVDRRYATLAEAKKAFTEAITSTLEAERHGLIGHTS